MRPTTPATVRALRRMALLLLIGSLVLSSARGSAEHDLTCHPSGGGGGINALVMSDSPGQENASDDSVALTIRFADDGAPAVHGAIIMKGSTIGQNATDAAQLWTALAVSGGAASATCADGDGDGLVGLMSLTADLRNAQMGAIVRVTITPDREIDASGRYTITVRGPTREPIVLPVRVKLRGAIREVETRSEP